MTDPFEEIPEHIDLKVVAEAVGQHSYVWRWDYEFDCPVKIHLFEVDTADLGIEEAEVCHASQCPGEFAMDCLMWLRKKFSGVTVQDIGNSVIVRVMVYPQKLPGIRGEIIVNYPSGPWLPALVEAVWEVLKAEKEKG